MLPALTVLTENSGKKVPSGGSIVTWNENVIVDPGPIYVTVFRAKPFTRLTLLSRMAASANATDVVPEFVSVT